MKGRNRYLRIISIATATVAMLIGTSAFAADGVWHSSKIKNVYPHANGSVVLIFHDQAPTCTNANNPNYHYLAVGLNGVTQEGLNAMYAASLMAMSAGFTVSINFDNTTPDCAINRLIVIDN